ncbi:DUF3540 domain-containing protein [Collimonas humicola]|uniref:DUF3540 domain-containing protein n=1 Tax=Collimonas humicola TaxID=2825886 RepID=UPI001B8B42BA|nr:DUF3540 domain-containing protein [Collimonas humicola]
MNIKNSHAVKSLNLNQRFDANDELRNPLDTGISSEDELKELLRGTEHVAEKLCTARLSRGLNAQGNSVLLFEDGKSSCHFVRVALSCLIQPVAGDLVQIFFSKECYWILAVLERRDNSQGIHLNFEQHSVSLLAGQIELRSTSSMTLSSQELSLKANLLSQTLIERQTHISGSDTTHAGSVALYAQRHMGFYSKVTTFAAQSLLKIDGGQIHMG